MHFLVSSLSLSAAAAAGLDVRRRMAAGVPHESDGAFLPGGPLWLYRLPCRGCPCSSCLLHARPRWAGPPSRVGLAPTRSRTIHWRRPLPSLDRGDGLHGLLRGRHGVGVLSLCPGSVPPLRGRGLLADGGQLGLQLPWVQVPPRTRPGQRGVDGPTQPPPGGPTDQKSSPTDCPMA